MQNGVSAVTANRTTYLINQYLKDIGHLRVLTAEGERELIDEIGAGSESALKTLCLCSQHVVIEEVLYFAGRGLPLEDLIQTANLALVRCLKKYRSGMENLKNYLHRNIYWALDNAFREEVSIIRYPHNRFDEIVSHYDRKVFEDPVCLNQLLLENEDREQPGSGSLDPSFDYLSVPYMRIQSEVLNFMTSSSDVPSSLLTKSAETEIRRVLDTLSERERDVIKMYFGIDVDRALTLQEIGDLFRLTRERVRQIKNDAMNRLNHKSRESLLRPLLSCFNSSSWPDSRIPKALLAQFPLSDPFSSIRSDERVAIRCLRQYVRPRRRKTPYPEVRNMAQACRKVILTTLKSRGRPCSYDELRDFVLEKYPLLRGGTIEYALKTAKDVISIGKGRYALKNWGFLEHVSKSKPKPAQTKRLREAILTSLQHQETPVSFEYLLSRVASQLGTNRFMHAEEKRIMRVLKRLGNVHRTLDNRYYLV